MQFLDTHKPTSLGELNDCFFEWLDTDYHTRKHSSTATSPFSRFLSKMEIVKKAPRDLKRYFRKTAIRTITKDRTVSLNGKLYEAPVALIGKRVTLLFHSNESESVEVRYKDKSYGFITLVDLQGNCRVKRDRNRQPELVIPEENKSGYKGGSLWTMKKQKEGENGK